MVRVGLVGLLQMSLNYNVLIAFYKANWNSLSYELYYGWQPVRFGDPKVRFRID